MSTNVLINNAGTAPAPPASGAEYKVNRETKGSVSTVEGGCTTGIPGRAALFNSFRSDLRRRQRGEVAKVAKTVIKCTQTLKLVSGTGNVRLNIICKITLMRKNTTKNLKNCN